MRIGAVMRAIKAAMIMAAFLLCAAGGTAAQDDAIIDRKDIPKAVAAEVDCGTDPDYATRRPFAGGFVFAWRCPGNNANYMQALVFAPREDGSGAKRLSFPDVRRKSAAFTELSNVRFYPAAREITQLFVDDEAPRICRSEARWRLIKHKNLKHKNLDGTPELRLIYWRETRDCAGKRGWRVVLDKRYGD
jgi:hypothetical protein